MVFGAGIFGSGYFGGSAHFPAGPLGTLVELQLGGVWTDITSDVYQRDDITIHRGRPGEFGEVEPSNCTMTLNNREGKYSPRNPMGPHYGTLGRNTPIRVSVPGDEVRMVVRDRDTDGASTPDSAFLSVTGDLDVRVELNLTEWVGSSRVIYAAKYEDSGDQRSWYFGRPDRERFMSFAWSTTGTAGGILFAEANAPIPHPATGRLAVRATIDVDNGAGGHTVTFYYADTIAGPWTQLGDPYVGAGVTSIFNSTAPVWIHQGHSIFLGDEFPNQEYALPYVEVYEAEIRNGIGGTVIASPDFAAQDAGAASFVDAQGNTWTLQGGTELTDRLTRFIGEVSSWPQKWDRSGSDVWVPIEAAGILRRLSQGSYVQSPMYQELANDAITLFGTAEAYWPCESGASATEFPSAFASHPAGTIANAPTSFAVDNDFFSSGDLPEFGGSNWIFGVPAYTPGTPGRNTIGINLSIPNSIGGDYWIARAQVGGGTLIIIGLLINALGQLRAVAVDSSFAVVGDTGWGAISILGKRGRVHVTTEQVGADVLVFYSFYEQGSETGAGGFVTVVAATPGTVQGVSLNPFNQLTDVAAGHVAVHGDIIAVQLSVLGAFSGETAAARIQRLCTGANVPFTIYGDTTTSSKMGRQGKSDIVELLLEAAKTDGGQFFESRDFAGVAYKTRDVLSAREPVLELDYAAADLSEFEPVDDDQNTRNDLTIIRQGGSSIRATDTDGPLGTNTIGEYSKSETISLGSDEQLADQASWRLHMGTVDEPRFPAIAINLARSNFIDDDALTAAARTLELGDRIRVANPPAWMPPDDIDQLVQGLTERLRTFEWTIVAVGSPATPWDVGVYDDGESRYESLDCVLAEDLDTTETAIDVTSSAPWSALDAPYDLYIGGERVTLTAVSAIDSPQTLTVTRSVNGIVKTHAAGTEVRLFKQSFYAI